MGALHMSRPGDHKSAIESTMTPLVRSARCACGMAWLRSFTLLLRKARYRAGS
jgi:hypothetical protein